MKLKPILVEILLYLISFSTLYGLGLLVEYLHLCTTATILCGVAWFLTVLCINFLILFLFKKYG